MLVKQIKSGSTEALEELINKYYNDIFSYSYRILGSYHEAEDVTHEVFMSMMKAITSYKEESKFKAWIFTIAHNKCMNIIAMRKKYSDISDIMEVADNEDFTVRESEREYVKAILNTLPENQRYTLILKYYYNLTAKEIGKITNSKISTVKSRLFQGIQKLKNLLRENK